MSIGSSGRIVIEVEPKVKRSLYAALARDGSTLKEWFLKSADAYLAGSQMSLLPTETKSSDASGSLGSDPYNETKRLASGQKNSPMRTRSV